MLMVAYHYPPIQASSGVHRTLGFSEYAVRHGWATTVLTVTRGALLSYRDENESMIPPGVEVLRAPALDATRHLNVRGKYPGFLAIPDRWVSWVAPALLRGLAHALRHRPDVLYSTYPIATAHVIGYLLHRLTGIPWVADFRDPMAQDGYPADPRAWRAFRWIETRAARHASRLVFTAPGAMEHYATIFPDAVRERGIVIENGYDEALFVAAEEAGTVAPRTGPLRLVHSGILYPSERDPSCFFAAVRELVAEGRIAIGEVEFILRGSGHDDHYRPLLEAMGLARVVKLEPPNNYREALAEMLAADALLVFQAGNCNYQIPAKIYEYFRARRPIVAFTDLAGDTAAVLSAAGVPWIAPLDSTPRIKQVLAEALGVIARSRDAQFGSEAFVRACARSARGQEFLALLEGIERG